MTDLSIITVLFNPIKNGRKEMLLQAITSVANQKYNSYEHIIIDGASTDGTVELLSELKSQGKISHFISEPDKGIYDAMNKGVALAKGTYIGFLNSDDYYSDMQAFSNIMEHIKGCDYCYSPVKIENQHGVIDGYFKPSISRFLTKMPFAHQSLIVKKFVFEKLGGFDISFKLAADYDFIIRMCLLAFKGICIDEPFSVFRMGGVSDTDSDKGKTEKMRVWQKNYGDADYHKYINQKTLPFKALINILKKYPHIYKAVFLEMFRNLRKR